MDMLDIMVDPAVLIGLHPSIPPTASPSTARLALLNYIRERAVLFEPMAPDALVRAAFSGPAPRLVLSTDPRRQRAYMDAFLSALVLSEAPDEPARELVCWLSWLVRRVDQAVR